MANPDSSCAIRPDARRQAAAARMRLTRRRRALGAIHISLDVFSEGIADLVDLGWLAAKDAGNRDAVKDALAALVGAAVAAELRPARE